MTKTQIENAIAKAIQSGNWMIRFEKEGRISPFPDAHGFQWKPLGQWTIAPDWNDKPICGKGLHGQGPEAGGQAVKAKYIVFCETRGKRVVLSGDKVKVKEARRLMLGQLPSGLTVKSSLDLSGCDLGGITLPQFVGGGSLYLRGCDLGGVTLPQSVGGSLDLRGCNLGGVTLPQSVGGYLDLGGCDLKGVTLPQSVGGYLYLGGCDLKGVTLPDNLKRKVIT